MTTSDEQIGRNLAQLRGDMSQKDLAAEMRKRGWKWSQATVWSIEKGERPLRLAEAQDIVALMEADLWLLTLEEATVRAARRAQRVELAEAALKEAIREFDEARYFLALELDQATTDYALSMGQLVETSAAKVAEIEHRDAMEDPRSTFGRARSNVDIYREQMDEDRPWTRKLIEVDYGVEL